MNTGLLFFLVQMAFSEMTILGMVACEQRSTAVTQLLRRRTNLKIFVAGDEFPRLRRMELDPMSREMIGGVEVFLTNYTE